MSSRIPQIPLLIFRKNLSMIPSRYRIGDLCYSITRYGGNNDDSL
jgi:hypothetical protein